MDSRKKERERRMASVITLVGGLLIGPANEIYAHLKWAEWTKQWQGKPDYYNVEPPEPAARYEGKLVCLSGRLKTAKPLQDPWSKKPFLALRLERQVEKFNGIAWYVQPTQKLVVSADEAHLGGFRLKKEVLESLKDWSKPETVNIDANTRLIYRQIAAGPVTVLAQQRGQELVLSPHFAMVANQASGADLGAGRDVDQADRLTRQTWWLRLLAWVCLVIWPDSKKSRLSLKFRLLSATGYLLACMLAVRFF